MKHRIPPDASVQLQAIQSTIPLVMEYMLRLAREVDAVVDDWNRPDRPAPRYSGKIDRPMLQASYDLRGLIDDLHKLQSTLWDALRMENEQDKKRALQRD